MPEQAAPVVSARGFSKTFGGRTVLCDVDLDVLAGEVHGLVGQNGSGKSTFIKLLSGYHDPDPGAALTVGAVPVSPPFVGHPALQGLCFVHQDLALAPTMTVLDNLRLGRYETGHGWRIPWTRERARVRSALAEFGMAMSPDTLVSDLRDVERAMLAILRALDRLDGVEGGGLLVLDEPTAYLPRDGVEHLLRAIRRVTSRGVGVLFVTHRLDEVRAVTDRVTVLRNGRHIVTTETPSLTEEGLAEVIIGHALGELYPSPHAVGEELVLSVRDLSGDGLSAPFSLQLRRGEIVGLTGLVGMGYEVPLYLLSGAGPAVGGEIDRGGETYDVSEMTARRAIELGLAFLPANRLRLGGTKAATVAENVTLPTLGQFFSRGILHHSAEARRVSELLHSFEVTPADPDANFGSLSGGNQQKALMAKWFATNPSVLLLHEPTQGVDVGSRRQLFEYVRNLADAGAGVVIASAEYEDLANLCDRVLVFRNGAVAKELHGAALTDDHIFQQSLIDHESETAQDGRARVSAR